jgi:hypothetical protein
MPKRTEAPPQRQFRRVAAWIYVVINPIIDSLQRELSFLESGNLSWRSRTNKCEFLRTIQEYVESTQWPNFQDFMAEHKASAFIPGFKQHDSTLERLNTAAREVFVWLINSKTFLDSFDTALAQYESQKASLGPQAQSLVDMKTMVRDEAAEHVINNTSMLPSHYVISSFWNSSGRNLLLLRNIPEFQPLHHSRNSLLGNSARLKTVLESYRLSLSRKYDVPAAPVPGVTFDE